MCVGRALNFIKCSGLTQSQSKIRDCSRNGVLKPSLSKMPKLPALKPRQVVKVLEGAGFILARSKGSHRIYVKGNIGITIPFHNKDLRKGTLRQIIKQSGLTLEEFLELP